MEESLYLSFVNEKSFSLYNVHTQKIFIAQHTFASNAYAKKFTMRNVHYQKISECNACKKKFLHAVHPQKSYMHSLRYQKIPNT